MQEVAAEREVAPFGAQAARRREVKPRNHPADLDQHKVGKRADVLVVDRLAALDVRDDFRAVRGNKADVEDVIEIPRSVAKNEIALFFYQIPDRTKETRCSIRTRGDWDATALAAKFGGGGHRKAAGCTIKATMGSAKRQMRAAVKDLLKSACRKTMRLPPNLKV